MTATMKLTPKEHTFRTDDGARITRRTLINAGRAVSLLSYDGERDLYVFDEWVDAAEVTA